MLVGVSVGVNWICGRRGSGKDESSFLKSDHTLETDSDTDTQHDSTILKDFDDDDGIYDEDDDAKHCQEDEDEDLLSEYDVISCKAVSDDDATVTQSSDKKSSKVSHLKRHLIPIL